jgi:8-oxo-dGTP diphosphatase
MDDEQAFLATYDPTRYPRPSVAVDVVLLTVAGDELKTLLVRRPVQPQQGLWALPGTFLGPDESTDEAAARALAVKAGIADVFTEQLYTFGSPSRDPRTRVLSIAHYALIEPARLAAAAEAKTRGGRALVLATLAVDANGHVRSVQARDEAGRPLLLAFDHAAILAAAVERIRGKLDYVPIGFELLPETFTLLDLRRVHEAIHGRPLNKDSFRRTVLTRGLVEPTGRRATGLGHRPPELYRFRRPTAGAQR